MESQLRDYGEIFRAVADVLLEKFIGTTTHDPSLVSDAMDVIRRKTDELEQLYGSQKWSAIR